jgi:tripeptide aminopeptidase
MGAARVVLGMFSVAAVSAALATSAEAQAHGPGGRSSLCAAATPRCAEIMALAGRAEVRRAFDIIDATDTLAIRQLVELTAVPAPPFMEEERAAAYADMLGAAGADSVWMDSIGNVLALRRGTARTRTVAVAGHLDTVFPEGTDVTVQFRGDTLRAPGVGDDTRGLIAIAAMLRALSRAEVRTGADILFIGTVGEEGLGDLRGVKHLFRQGGPRIDAFIAVDGGNDASIVHQALGSIRYRVTFVGPGGHSWGAFGLGNPSHALGAAIARFDIEASALTSGAASRTSYNVGRIGGGTSVNSIPFEAWMEVDMRSEGPAQLSAIDALFHASVRRALDEYNSRLASGRVAVEIERVGDRPTGGTPPAAPLLQRAIAATLHFGHAPVLGRSSTDANVPISLGVPAITIGGGGTGGNAHSLDEWWLNEDGPAGIKRALLILLAEAA